jgi:hypothetical protein
MLTCVGALHSRPCFHLRLVIVGDPIPDRTMLHDGVIHVCDTTAMVTRGALSVHLMCVALLCYSAPR